MNQRNISTARASKHASDPSGKHVFDPQNDFAGHEENPPPRRALADGAAVNLRRSGVGKLVDKSLALLAMRVKAVFEGLSGHGPTLSSILWPMPLSSAIRRGRHCVFQMHVHLVFVTKYRRSIFDDDALRRLRTYFEKVCTDFEAQLVEMNGQTDHLHLLINYPPKHSVSTLVNSLKGVSSRLLRLERPDIQRRYWKGVLWSPSYFAASCGGAPISILREYIEQQNRPG